MNFVLFYHSLASCWNHGNAHFLRGIVRELLARGHEVTLFEPAHGWSRTNAVADGGAAMLAEAETLVPGVRVRRYHEDLDLADATDGADVVIAHEWNEPALIADLGKLRSRGHRFTLLFHDTHHRAVTAPHEIEHFDLSGYDAALVFGDVLRDVYRRNRWACEVFTWHEAADVALFKPPSRRVPERDLVWIGNWGDDERDAELRDFLIEPVAELRLSARIHGVRYPESIKGELAAHGIDYAGWLPNHRAPAAFAHARFTVHVPRRPYATALPGIPTIRVFEALACGIPLISAPWDDAESLFPQGCYLTAHTGAQMRDAMRQVIEDRPFAQAMAARSLEAIRARHTCAHRVGELLAILDDLGLRLPREPADALAS